MTSSSGNLNGVRDDSIVPSQQGHQADARRRPMGAMGAARQKQRGSGINNDLEEGSVETVYSEDSDGSFTKESSTREHKDNRSSSPPTVITSADRAYQAAQAHVAAHAQQQQALAARQQQVEFGGASNKKDAVLGKLRRGKINSNGGEKDHDSSFALGQRSNENESGNMAPISIGGNVINADISRAQKRAEAGGGHKGDQVRGLNNIAQIGVGGSALGGMGRPVQGISNNVQQGSRRPGQRPKPRVMSQGNPFDGH